MTVFAALETADGAQKQQNDQILDGDQQNLSKLVGKSLQSAVNRIISERESGAELIEAAASAVRAPINNYEKANFFAVTHDDAVGILDHDGVQLADIGCADAFMEAFGDAVLEVL